MKNTLNGTMTWFKKLPTWATALITFGIFALVFGLIILFVTLA